MFDKKLSLLFVISKLSRNADWSESKSGTLSGAQGKRTKGPNSLRVHMGRFSGKPIKLENLSAVFSHFAVYLHSRNSSRR